MFRLSYEPYALLISTHRLSSDEMLHSRARLLDLHEDEEAPADLLSLAAFHDQQQDPLLLLTCAYRLGPGVGLYPGVLLVPETGLLLVGVGEQLLAYRLDSPTKLWQETADGGFWEWRRYQDVC
jgi:hypothetical protein